MTNLTAAGDLECVEVVITAESVEWLADFTCQLVEDRLVACGHNFADPSDLPLGRAGARRHPGPRRTTHPRIPGPGHRELGQPRPRRRRSGVIALPISLGHPAYLQWIYDETQRCVVTC